MEKMERRVRSVTKRPNRVLYGFFKSVIGGGFKRRADIKFVNCDIIRKCKTPFVVIANHVSRSDFVLTALACGKPVNFVATEYEFYNSINGRFIRRLGAIPKYLYQKDIASTMEMMRVVKSGGNLALFPEGILSITGKNRPMITGTGRFLKKLGVRVFVLKLKGAYSVRPRYATNFHRGAHVVVEAQELWDIDKIDQYDAVQLDDIVRSAIAHDESAYMATQPAMLPSVDGFAYNMQYTLYKCPCCGGEGTIDSRYNTLSCRQCGASATVDGRLNICDIDGQSSFGYHSTAEWWEYQLQQCGKTIDSGGEYMHDTATMYRLDKSKYSKDPYVQCGQGKVWLDMEGLHFDGEKDGVPFVWHVPSDSQPAIPAGSGNYIESYYHGEYYRFNLNNNALSMKWTCMSAEMTRRSGKWPM